MPPATRTDTPSVPSPDLSLIWSQPQYRDSHLYVTTCIALGNYALCSVCKRVVGIAPIRDEALTAGVVDGLAVINDRALTADHKIRCVADAQAI